jgi:hypothetical protein
MKTARPIPIALSALVALFSAAAALAFSNGMDMAQAHGDATAHGAMSVSAAPDLSRKAVELRADMRKLWEDHVMWTRLAIIALEGNAPNANATVTRLLRNQVDIGNAVKPFYGKAAGNALTAQLKEHILIAAEVIAAAKAGDQAKLASAQKRWQRNADGIAAFLSKANPRNWPLAMMKAGMTTHLQLTTAEAVAHLRGKWAADVAAFDRVNTHILGMSDALSNGLIKQFPQRFE